MSNILSNGQLAVSAGTLMTGQLNGSTYSIFLANTSGSLTEVVLLTITHGSTTTRIARLSLAPNEQGSVRGIFLENGDTLNGSTTDATTVDYTVTSVNTMLNVECFDATGALKSTANSTGGNASIGGTLTVTGASTLTGRTLIQRVADGPAPTDTYSGAMTIDMTYGLHVVAASNTTSGACTMTPSAAGSAGDQVKIMTECDNTGTVTTTFASTFHPSATQVTTASRFSTVVFESDGTRWLEICRTTNMA